MRVHETPASSTKQAHACMHKQPGMPGCAPGLAAGRARARRGPAAVRVPACDGQVQRRALLLALVGGAAVQWAGPQLHELHHQPAPGQPLQAPARRNRQHKAPAVAPLGINVRPTVCACAQACLLVHSLPMQGQPRQPEQCMGGASIVRLGQAGRRAGGRAGGQAALWQPPSSPRMHLPCGKPQQPACSALLDRRKPAWPHLYSAVTPPQGVLR